MQLKLTERDVIMVARLHPADVVTCRVTPAAPRGFGHGTSSLPNTQNGGAPPPPFLSACCVTPNQATETASRVP